MPAGRLPNDCCVRAYKAPTNTDTIGFAGVHARMARQVRLGEAVAGGELEVLAGIGSGERVSLTPLKAGIELKAAPAAAQ